MRSGAARVLLIALLLAGAAPASAQEAPPSWSAFLLYELDAFTGSSPVWTRWSAARVLVSRRMDRFTVGGEAALVHRFGLRDETLAAEAYATLWPGAYAHVRGQIAPDARLGPESDVRVALFHALPLGWEASGSVWMQSLPGPDVTVVGLGVGRYRGLWYLRAQGSLARIAGSGAGAGAAFARRFLGDDSREYVEVGAGLGSEVVVLGAGPVLDTRGTRFVAVAFQRFLRGPFGVHADAGLNDFEGVPLRRHVGVGLIARF